MAIPSAQKVTIGICDLQAEKLTLPADTQFGHPRSNSANETNQDY